MYLIINFEVLNHDEVYDGNDNILLRVKVDINNFKIVNSTCFLTPLLVYLNVNSPVFNRLIVKANPKLRLLNGVVPNSDKERRAKILVGKDRLIKGVTDEIVGYFIKVDINT